MRNILVAPKQWKIKFEELAIKLHQIHSKEEESKLTREEEEEGWYEKNCKQTSVSSSVLLDCLEIIGQVRMCFVTQSGWLSLETIQQQMAHMSVSEWNQASAQCCMGLSEYRAYMRVICADDQKRPESFETCLWWLHTMLYATNSLQFCLEVLPESELVSWLDWARRHTRDEDKWINSMYFSLVDNVCGYVCTDPSKIYSPALMRHMVYALGKHQHTWLDASEKCGLVAFVFYAMLESVLYREWLGTPECLKQCLMCLYACYLEMYKRHPVQLVDDDLLELEKLVEKQEPQRFVLSSYTSHAVFRSVFVPYPSARTTELLELCRSALFCRIMDPVLEAFVKSSSAHAKLVGSLAYIASETKIRLATQHCWIPLQRVAQDVPLSDEDRKNNMLACKAVMEHEVTSALCGGRLVDWLRLTPRGNELVQVCLSLLMPVTSLVHACGQHALDLQEFKRNVLCSSFQHLDVCGYAHCTKPKPDRLQTTQTNARLLHLHEKHETTAIVYQKCSRCRLIRYCSAACQHADWKTHRSFCRSVPLLPSVLFLPNQSYNHAEID